MNPEYVALLAGMVGALIGGAVSIITMWLQQHHQAKRESTRLAMKTAIKDYTTATELCKLHVDAGKKATLPPLILYMAYHAKFIELLQKGDVNPSTLGNLTSYWKVMEEEIRKAK